jgi:hypothetical protein
VWEEESVSLLRERLVEVNLSLMEDNWGGFQMLKTLHSRSNQPILT